jgi:hypothetical protein
MEVVAWQPNLLGRASKSAQEGDKPSVCRIRRGVPGDSVVGDAEASLVVRFMFMSCRSLALVRVLFLP